jgi:DNA repair exonuclease SbcCD ATPase subunit
LFLQEERQALFYYPKESNKMTDPVAPVTQVVTEPEATPAAQIAEVVQEEQFDKDRAMALIEKLRGEVKDLKPKAKKADDLEAAEKQRKEAEMTELQKAQAKIDELTAKTKAAELRELRRKVGEAAKLPAEIYELLPEGTEDEMKAKAEALAKALPKPQPGLSATNPPAGTGTITDAQRRAFLNGGPLPG